MDQPENKKDSPLWFLYIYGGFGTVIGLFYLGEHGKVPGGPYPSVALSIFWLIMVSLHFFKKRPKKQPPASTSK